MHACSPSKNRLAALVLGLGLIALGVVHGLKALGYLDLEGLLFFWPSALAVLALVFFARRGFLAFGGHVILLAAVALQAKAMGHGDLVHRAWPVALIWVGLVQVFRSLLRKGRACGLGDCENAGERLP